MGVIFVTIEKENFKTIHKFMKKNYIVCLIATLFLFAFQIGQAQKSLSNNEFGSLIQDWLDFNKDKHYTSLGILGL